MVEKEKTEYFNDYIFFRSKKILLSDIRHLTLDECLANADASKALSKIYGICITRGRYAGWLEHYQIKLNDEQKKIRKEKRNEAYRQACLKKYGTVNGFQAEAVKEKIAETKQKRYKDPRYNNPEKNKKTCMERYHVPSASCTPEVRNKVEATCLKKFGAKAPAQNPEVLQKMKDTCMERFGKDNYWKSDSFLKPRQEEYFTTHPELTSLYKEIYQDKDKIKAVVESFDDQTVDGIGKKFGLTAKMVWSTFAKLGLTDLIKRDWHRSSYEKELVDFIGKDLCITNDQQILAPQELDIYIPSKKLGIEFNGTYWHSSLNKPKKYHFNKAKLAEEKGIRLIQIWEYEWKNPKQKEKIKMMLNAALGRISEKIYARQCEVKRITNNEATALNNKVHLQGHRNAQVTYGLFYQNRLVQLMSFSHNKKYEWEIIRGCPGSNCCIIGGVEKLFTHFVKDYAPREVFSYCDFNKFDGRSYSAIGMKFIGYTGPDMKWLLRDGQVVNRQPEKHRELKGQAIAQLWGAGSKKYLWQNTNNRIK